MRAWLFTATLLALAGCKFSPDLTGGGGADAGALRCGTSANECPTDLVCKAGYCCKATGDPRAVCGGSVPPGTGGVGPGPTPPDGGGTETAPVVDMGAPPSDAEMPAIVPRRIVAGNNVHLVSFDDACTHGLPASSPNRWCAFTRGTELWVIDVTRAAKEAVTCNGTDPGCKLLTSKLFAPAATSKNNAHAKARFFGDLLIYYADAMSNVAADEFYRGGIYGWHPTFTEPRRLTSATGFSCESHERVSAPAAWCLDGTLGGTASELRAGLSTPGQPLPTLWTLTANDRFAVEINRAGDRMVFMQRTGEGPRALSLIPTAEAADATKRVALSPNVLNFEVSVDGTLAYVIREEGRKGGLFTVDTATGTKVVEIAPAIEGVLVLPDDRGNDLGFATLEGFAGETAMAKLYLDRANPMKTVALGRIGGLGVSSDRAFSIISSAVVTTPERRQDAKIFDNSGVGAACSLQDAPRTQRTYPFFSPSSRLVYWTEPSADPAFEQAFIATTRGCMGKHAVTGQLLSFHGLGTEAILFKQRNAQPGMTGIVSTLHYRRFSPETAATTAATTIHEGVGFVAVVEPDRKLAVFSSTKTGAEGIFVIDVP